MSRPTTRLAPSPTGALHLGNARTFLINWALARQRGWSVVLRIEDLDTPRVKSGSHQQAIDVLKWLGLDWDQGPFYQKHDLSPYHAALDRLAGMGLIYPCTCSRADIELAASAPHETDHEMRYPGTHRPLQRSPTMYTPLTDTAWRLIVPEGGIEFEDQVAGGQRFDVQREVGDFVVATKLGLPAYQLAVVVDDARQGVSDVVRGDDLLASAARQLLLYRMLELGNEPRYWHLPLVRGADGLRLAKRHGDTRLVRYMDAGASPQRVIGLIARWSGCGEGQPMSSGEFADRFDIDRLPREPVTFTADEDKHLCED